VQVKQVKSEFETGEMLRLIHYNCEGVEPPWGFHVDLAEDLLRRESMSSSQFRERTRRARVGLKEGDIAVSIKRFGISHATIDDFYVVLVDGMKLCVYTRFLSRIDDSV